MRKYELVCILDPQAVGEANFDAAVAKYEGQLTSRGAEIANIDRWGMRQLMYSSPSLRKRRHGYYVLYQFTADPSIVAPLEHDLKLDEGLLRHLIVLVEGEFLRVPTLVPDSVIAAGPQRPGRDRHERSGRDGRPRDRDRDRDGDRRREGPPRTEGDRPVADGGSGDEAQPGDGRDDEGQDDS